MHTTLLRVLFRVLSDSAMGSVALPAQNDWRAANGSWRLLAGSMDFLSSVPCVLWFHGVVQVDLTAALGALNSAAGAPLAPAASVLALSAAFSRLAIVGGDDGCAAELEALMRAEKTADAFFALTARSEGNQEVTRGADGEDGTEQEVRSGGSGGGSDQRSASRAESSAAAFRALAGAWRQKFGRGSAETSAARRAASKNRAWAFEGATCAALAAAWELSVLLDPPCFEGGGGGASAAATPWFESVSPHSGTLVLLLAHAVRVIDMYGLRPQMECNRVTVELSSLLNLKVLSQEGA